MSRKYDVFMCHRGPDTKRNFVSVLNGMLRTKGILCFVDYEMEEGYHVDTAIKHAIETSSVHIIILSPQFLGSKYCVDEVLQIIEAHKSNDKSHRPCKGITVFYDVQRTRQAKATLFDSSKTNRSFKEQSENWFKALELIYDFKYFEYNSKSTFQWEKLEEIVAEIGSFLNEHKMISNNYRKIRISREIQSGPHDVFICHSGQNIRHNVVSVLRGMLMSRGIRCFVVGYGRESESMTEVKMVIQNSKVHVIFLCEKFARSKQCLEEVVQIMKQRSHSDLQSNIVPVFYDVQPTVVGHQTKGSSYDLQNVQGSTRKEKDEWCEALNGLSKIKGTLYDSSTRFQWETLYDIFKGVERLVMGDVSRNDDLISRTSYQGKINQVSRILKLDDAQDVSVIGVYGRSKTQFTNLLVETFRSHFDAVYSVYTVLEKARDARTLSDLVEEVRKCLIQQIGWGNSSWPLLKFKKCLVVFDDLGNNIEQISKLLQKVRKELGNGSLVVLASEFRHMLEDLSDVQFIDLSLAENRGIVNICCGERKDTVEPFLQHLEETFCMLGLHVRLLDKDEVARLQVDEVLLSILSESFSIGDFKSIFTNAVIPPKTIYASYGSYRMEESVLNTDFKLEGNFEMSALDKWELKSMVKKVVQMLNEEHEKIMDATDFPVGVAHRVKQICGEIESISDQSVGCFALVGMGGVGKTTLAMSAYNKLRSNFETSFFSLNTRATVANDSLGLVAVQKNILINLSNKYNGEEINNEVHGKALLSSRLKGINALIVLDDVDESRHINALYDPLRCSLGPKSLVIITTRNKEILEWAAEVKTYDVKPLDREMSEKLFYWHAFMKPMPPADLEEIAGSVIRACEGLPFSLKVMGSHLYQKSDPKYWKESLFRLERSEDKIFEVLRISYYGLGSDAKEAFLDICCFLIGEDESIACMVLEACYGIGLSHIGELKGRCLISNDAEDGGKTRRIRMHDQVRDMGRHIIGQSSRDRAWDHETAKNILQDEKARSLLRGLLIRSHNGSLKGASDCKWLPALRILVVEEDEGETREGELCSHEFFENVHCDGLRWLRWRNAPFKKLPLGVRSTSIRVLDLSGAREITELPMDLLTNLQALDVSGCKKLNGLDSRIGRLTNLTYLNLSECDDIRSLPQEMACLSSLEQLNMDLCSSLTTLAFLPTSLQRLSLSMDENQPGSLESVNLHGSLPSLQELTITWCTKLESLSLDAGSMQRLFLTGCCGLKKLGWEGLPCLEELNLDHCSSLGGYSCPTTMKRISFVVP